MPEITIDQAVRKVERYIEQILPLPTCPQSAERVKWQRDQVRMIISDRSKIGPSQIK